MMHQLKRMKENLVLGLAKTLLSLIGYERGPLAVGYEIYPENDIG